VNEFRARRIQGGCSLHCSLLCGKYKRNNSRLKTGAVQRSISRLKNRLQKAICMNYHLHNALCFESNPILGQNCFLHMLHQGLFGLLPRTIIRGDSLRCGVWSWRDRLALRK
jgi:hypothetical protein